MLQLIEKAEAREKERLKEEARKVSGLLSVHGLLAGNGGGSFHGATSPSACTQTVSLVVHG